MVDQLGLQHVGVVVSDMAAAVEFYRDTLGFQVTMDVTRKEGFIGEIVGMPKAEVRVVYLVRDGISLELLKYKDGLPRRYADPEDTAGRVHFCFLTDDMDRWLDRLKMRLVGVATIPDGRNAGARAAYFHGPDNVTIEFFEKASA